MSEQNVDKKTLELIKQVNKQKSEIAKLDRPNWLTNCSVEINGKHTNIHVEASIPKLVEIAGFLLGQEESFQKASDFLELEPSKYLWNGYAVSEWLTDIKSRIAKIRIGEKRKKLELLESRLNAIISPELRAHLELEAITNELCE
jgi:hypothetical protein